ncbi:S16 family serine protease, partial [Candidatus Omnitrophota bacterium]
MRPVLVEIQALVAKSSFGMVRRKTSGFEFNRFSLLIGSQDVFVNVTGGIKIDDPSADLALVVAIASSFQDFVVSPEFIFIGEVGLSGELRMSYNISQRLMEAKRLGFSSAFIPETNFKKLDLKSFFGLQIHGCNNVKEVMHKVRGQGSSVTSRD